jgi:dipeptidyl aminopeptidase/acylaminoacyl peptidase
MWSHDGNWLAVQVRRTKHGKPVGPPVVWLVNPTGTAIRRLSPAGYKPSSVSWSPTGDQLAMVLTRHHRDRAEVVNVFAHRTTVAKAKRIAGVAWSPKGTSLALSRNAFKHHRWTSRLQTVASTGGHAHLVKRAKNTVLKVAGWWPDGRGVLAWNDFNGSASLAADGLPLVEFAVKSGHRRVLSKSVLQYQGWLSTSKRLNRVAFIAGGNRRLTSGHKHVVVCTTKRCHSIAQPRKRVTFDPAYSAAGRLAVVRDRALRATHGFGPKFAAAVANSGTIDVVGKHGVAAVKGAGAGATQPVWGRDGSLMFVRKGSLWLIAPGSSKAVRLFGPLQLPSDYFGFVPWLASFAWSGAA